MFKTELGHFLFPNLLPLGLPHLSEQMHDPLLMKICDTGVLLTLSHMNVSGNLGYSAFKIHTTEGRGLAQL